MSLWEQPLADVCSPPAEVGQQLCGAQERLCQRGSCVALRRLCDGTDDCGDGWDEDPAQCSEHPWPREEPCGRAEGLPCWGKAVLWPGRNPPKSTPHQEGKVTEGLQRGGSSPAHCRGPGPALSKSLWVNCCPFSSQRTSPTAPLTMISAAGRWWPGHQCGAGTPA